jgi:hypothetical protein
MHSLGPSKIERNKQVTGKYFRQVKAVYFSAKTLNHESQALVVILLSDETLPNNYIIPPAFSRLPQHPQHPVLFLHRRQSSIMRPHQLPSATPSHQSCSSCQACQSS